MIRINLLPKDYLQKKKTKAIRLLVSLALGGLGSVIIVVLISMYVTAIFALKNVQVSQKETEDGIATLSSTVQRVKELEQMQNELAEKTGYQQQLVGQQTKWSLVLRDFSKLVPEGVWIENMNMNDTGNMQIDGSTFTYESVAEFMMKLKSTDRFINIDFTTAQASKIGDEKVVKFSITSQLSKGSDKL